MKNKATPKKLFAMFLAATLVCTMLQCTFFTAFAEAATIDELITAVNADGKVTQTEAVSVNTIVDLYNAMDATTQANYTESVTNIKNEFFSVLKNGYTPFTTTEDVDFTTEKRLPEFSKDQWKQLAVIDGCVRYKLNNTGNCGLRIGPRTRMKLDGFEIMFNRLSEIPGLTHSQFRIGLQLTPGNADVASSSTDLVDFSVASTTGVLVHFDFMSGKLIYNLKKSSSDIRYLDLQDDRLKYENLRYRAFTVGFVKGDAETPLKVIVKIADGSDPIVLNVPAAYYDEVAVESADGNGNVLVGINRGYYTSTGADSPTGTVNLYLDLVGYRNTKAATAAVNAIKPLNVDTITEADAKTIYDVEDVVLTELDKAELGDSEKLSKLKEKLLKIAKVGLTTFKGTSDFTTDYWINDKTGYKFIEYVDGIARLTLSADGLSVAKRIGIKSAVKFDGLNVKFSRLKTTSNSATAAGVGLQFGTSAGADLSSASASGFFIYLDAKNGKLYVSSKNSGTVSSKVIATDNALLLQNIENRIFTIGINSTGVEANPYKITVKVAGGGTVVANIPSAYVTPSLFMNNVANGTTYLTYTRGGYDENGSSLSGTSYQTVDMIGYTNTANIVAAEALIAALPEVNAVTTNDGNVIFKAEQAYAALTADEKALVDNAKLTAVRAQYDALFTAETEALEYTVVTDTLLTDTLKVSTINSWWGKEFATELQGNGIRVKWGNGSKANRLAIGSAVNMDGLTLRFNNLKKTGTTKAELTVLLSRNSSNYHEGKGVPYFALVLDTEKGTLKVSTNWSNTDTTKQNFYDIIENDLLKYENIAGGKFTIGFEEVGELEYKATVTVGNQSVSGIIPAQALEDVSTGDVSLYNPKNCNFAIAAWSGNAQTVDVVGYKTEDTVQSTKIAGATLTVSDSISVNYKVSADILKANQYVNPEIKFEIAGSTLTVVGEKEEGTGYYNFTYPDIAPHLMNETITATLYAYRASNLENPILMGDTKEYSIKQYCYNMLEKYKDDEELCDLIVDLLRYGAASQTYVDKDAENLVTADLTTEQNSFGTTFVAPADSVASKVALSGTPATKYVSWKAVALYLADVVNLRYRFTLADGVDVDALKVTATVNGVPVTVENPEIESAGTNMYYLYFDAFSAANMRDVIKVTICDAEGNAVSTTATYSVESYVKAQLAKSPEADYEALLKALLCYGDSAKAYKNR